VIRYSWVAGSLPSEKISNLQFSEGFPVVRLLSPVPICPLLGRPVSPAGNSSCYGHGMEGRMPVSFIPFLVEISAPC
jgi:hypothetical protein